MACPRCIQAIQAAGNVLQEMSLFDVDQLPPDRDWADLGTTLLKLAGYLRQRSLQGNTTMPELRKKLTDVQMRQLAETQSAVAQARAVLEKVQADAQRVVQLIFDAHGVPMHYTADLDQGSGELVCTGEDLPEISAPMAPKLEK
jgi:hypothetical protein